MILFPLHLYILNIQINVFHLWASTCWLIMSPTGINNTKNSGSKETKRENPHILLALLFLKQAKSKTNSRSLNQTAPLIITLAHENEPRELCTWFFPRALGTVWEPRLFTGRYTGMLSRISLLVNPQLVRTWVQLLYANSILPRTGHWVPCTYFKNTVVCTTRIHG